MAVQIQVRRGTAAEWTTDNPTLAHGELAVELDTLKWKIGDGTTEWDSLPYAADGDTGPQGKGLEFDWDGTNLGVRVEGDASFIYEDISGQGLEFVWDGTQLGVRVENSGDSYQYVDLRGDDGFQGGSGIEVQDEPPEDTNVLWIDTEDPPAYPLPTGGFAGEVLTKNSSDFHDFDWSPVPSPAASNVVFTSSGLAVISGTSNVQAALEAADAALAERPTTQQVEDSLAAQPLGLYGPTDTDALGSNSEFVRVDLDQDADRWVVEGAIKGVNTGSTFYELGVSLRDDSDDAVVFSGIRVERGGANNAPTFNDFNVTGGGNPVMLSILQGGSTSTRWSDFYADIRHEGSNRTTIYVRVMSQSTDPNIVKSEMFGVASASTRPHALRVFSGGADGFRAGSVLRSYAYRKA